MFFFSRNDTSKPVFCVYFSLCIIIEKQMSWFQYHYPITLHRIRRVLHWTALQRANLSLSCSPLKSPASVSAKRKYNTQYNVNSKKITTACLSTKTMKIIATCAAALMSSELVIVIVLSLFFVDVAALGSGTGRLHPTFPLLIRPRLAQLFSAWVWTSDGHKNIAVYLAVEPG